MTRYACSQSDLHSRRIRGYFSFTDTYIQRYTEEMKHSLYLSRSFSFSSTIFLLVLSYFTSTSTYDSLIHFLHTSNYKRVRVRVLMHIFRAGVLREARCFVAALSDLTARVHPSPPPPPTLLYA